VVERNWIEHDGDDIRWITTDELASFITSRPQVVPEHVIRWLG
jgi:hypothetical protein